MEVINSINNAIEKLRDKGIIFLSETDFQFNLAWEIKNILGSDCENIILEYPYKNLDNKTIYIDIVVTKKTEVSFIELKYKTKKSKISRSGIYFELKTQGAQDLGRFYLIADIERMENINNPYPDKKMTNYCIFMTNDNSYKSSCHNAICKDFNFNSEIKSGEKFMMLSEGKKTEKTYKASISNTYKVDFKDYLLGFSYFLLEIKGS